MKYFIMSCKEATLLMAKDEEGKLFFFQRIKLSLHTLMCSLCKNFEKQISKIGKESRHVYGEDYLSASAKERISRMLEE